MDATDLRRGLFTQSVFEIHQFDHALKVAKVLAQSTLLPTIFRENIENCLVALELSKQMGISVIDVTRHLAPVDGQLGWRAEFIISRINTCGRFEPLEFEFGGEGETRCCVVKTNSLHDSKELLGTTITLQMVKLARWDEAPNSMWHFMPDQMLAYRAAAFWARLHAPELLHGIRFVDELEDARGSHPVKQINTALVEARDIDVLNELLASNEIGSIDCSRTSSSLQKESPSQIAASAIQDSINEKTQSDLAQSAVEIEEKVERNRPIPSASKSNRRTKRKAEQLFHDPLF